MTGFITISFDNLVILLPQKSKEDMEREGKLNSIVRRT